MIGVEIGPVLRQYLIVIVANLTFFQFGVTIGWMSPAMVRLREENQTVLPEPLTETETAWVMSISSVFALFGFTYVGLVANNLGRKISMLLAILPRIICCLFLLFASRVWMLYLGRVFCGLSDFAVITVTSVYISEIASKEIRGGLATLSQILSAIGIMVFLSVGPFISYMTINLIHTSIIVVSSIPLLFLPESPYFLYSIGKYDQALVILTYLRGNITSAQEELKDYSASKIETVKIKELLRDPVLLKTMGIVIFLAIADQMTGYSAVLHYLQIIFESTGTTVSAGISSVIVGCIQVFACVCTILLTDRFGRKPVLYINTGLGTFFKILDDGNEITGFLNYRPILSMVLVVFCYNSGMGSLLWIQIAELLDGRTRAFGITGAAFSAGTFTFLSIRYFASVAAVLGNSAVYWIFATFCMITCLFIAIVVPETKGKGFGQIQNELRSK